VAVRSGSQERETTWVERWRLELGAQEQNPWRITGAA
jgi:hypothetical protein